jgi:hypothetical protein
VSALRSRHDTIHAILSRIQSCPYDFKEFSGCLHDLQAVINELSLGEWSGLEVWVDSLDAKVRVVVAAKCGPLTGCYYGLCAMASQSARAPGCALLMWLCASPLRLHRPRQVEGLLVIRLQSALRSWERLFESSPQSGRRGSISGPDTLAASAAGGAPAGAGMKAGAASIDGAADGHATGRVAAWTSPPALRMPTTVHSVVLRKSVMSLRPPLQQVMYHPFQGF